MSADNKTFKCLALPFPGLADLRSEVPDFLDRVEYGGSRFDETPFVRELIDNVCRLCAEVFRALVETMKVES